MPFSRELLIAERDDFMENPLSGFYRLPPPRGVAAVTAIASSAPAW